MRCARTKFTADTRSNTNQNCKLDGNVRIADGCGEGGNACPSDYECRVPGTNGVGLCAPKNMGAGFNYGNIVVGPPALAVVQQPQPQQQLPAWPVAARPAGSAPPPRRPAAAGAARRRPSRPRAVAGRPPAAQQPAAPVAVQPPRPTAPAQQLGPPRPVVVAPPPQTVTVTGVWTPRGQNPPRPVREPPAPAQQQRPRPPQQQQQPGRPPPPQQQQQPQRPPPGYPNQQGGQRPPPGYPNQQGGQRPPPGYPNQQGGQRPPPYGNQGPSQQQPPRGPAPVAATGGRKMPLRVGECTDRERAGAKCRGAELCFPHPLRPVCVNPTTSDDCGYSRNQKLFGRGRFKECRAGEMCLVDYRATDGDDGICAVEPR